MARPAKTGNIRVGDRVRVVTPKLFVRCGYPLAFDAVLAEVRKNYLAATKTFLAAAGVKMAVKPYDGQPLSVEKVLRAVAYDLVRQRGYGGKDRRIITVDKPEWACVERAVTAVRFVKTGVYNRGYQDYSGDYQPPYLSDEKTHRILTLAGAEWLDDDPMYPQGGRWREVEIEATNVELVNTEEPT